MKTYPTLFMIEEGEKLANPWDDLDMSAEAGVWGGSGVWLVEGGGKGNLPPSSLGVFMNNPEPISATIFIGELISCFKNCLFYINQIFIVDINIFIICNKRL